VVPNCFLQQTERLEGPVVLTSIVVFVQLRTPPPCPAPGYSCSTLYPQPFGISTAQKLAKAVRLTAGSMFRSSGEEDGGVLAASIMETLSDLDESLDQEGSGQSEEELQEQTLAQHGRG